MIANNEIKELLEKCGLKPCNYNTVAKKAELLKAIWLHYVFFEAHAELQQFRKGFIETLQMEELLSLYPTEMRALLVPSDHKITASHLLDLFTIDYSESEEERDLEDKVIAHWQKYIGDIETAGTYEYNYNFTATRYAMTMSYT